MVNGKCEPAVLCESRYDRGDYERDSGGCVFRWWWGGGRGGGLKGCWMLWRFWGWCRWIRKVDGRGRREGWKGWVEMRNLIERRDNSRVADLNSSFLV